MLSQYLIIYYLNIQLNEGLEIEVYICLLNKHCNKIITTFNSLFYFKYCWRKFLFKDCSQM